MIWYWYTVDIFMTTHRHSIATVFKRTVFHTKKKRITWASSKFVVYLSELFSLARSTLQHHVIYLYTCVSLAQFSPMTIMQNDRNKSRQHKLPICSRNALSSNYAASSAVGYCHFIFSYFFHSIQSRVFIFINLLWHSFRSNMPSEQK